MPLLLGGHTGTCEPASPCISCQALEILKKKLSEPDFERISKLLEDSAPYEVRLKLPVDSSLELLEGLPLRVRRMLIKKNIRTIREILSKTDREVLGFMNFGLRSLWALDTSLALAGWRRGDPIPD